MAFSKDLHAPEGLRTGEFLLRPITAADAEFDYEAVMESKDFLRKWEQSSWPEDDFTVESNREDMAKMEQRHNEGYSFGYTVMDLDETQCLGCVYVFSSDARHLSKAEVSPVDGSNWSDCDAVVSFWVRKSHLADELDRRLLTELNQWFNDEWGFQNHVVITNEEFEQQVLMIESAGMKLKFRLKDPNNSGRELAYA